MKYKCIKKNKFDLWLTIGETYEGEVVVSPVELASGKYILIYKDDFRKQCYVEKEFFQEVYGEELDLGVS